MDQITKEIAEVLLQIKAIKLNANSPFTWASGLRSPIYCDNRKILAFPSSRKQVIKSLVLRSKSFSEFNAIAGVATAGIAWGAYLAEQLELPFCYVRSKPKEHGLKNLIEGELPSNSKILVVEDLISTGGSSIQAADYLKEQNHSISGILAIFQYGFDETNELFLKKQIQLLSLSDFSSLLEHSLLTQYLSQQDFENLKSWNKNPKLWSEQFCNHNESII